ncbi:hypothetical protein B0H19DRAFT_935535 [Mycena capillaripes]|nr:hypothetical protein B0H19DRAFT_935535 [Mycena capillaripes]
MAGNRCHIPPAQKWLVITMATHGCMKGPAIHDATGISVRTIYCILSTWRSTGKVVRVPLELGRPRILTALDVSFLEGLVERTPDIYTFELQQALANVMGIEVDKKTIRNALLRRGYTRKVMCLLSFCLCVS